MTTDQLDLDRQRLSAYERVLDTATDERSRTEARREIHYLKEQIERQERNPVKAAIDAKLEGGLNHGR